MKPEQIQKLKDVTARIEQLRDHMDLMQITIDEQLEAAEKAGLCPVTIEAVIMRREGGTAPLTDVTEMKYHQALGDKIEQNKVAA